MFSFVPFTREEMLIKLNTQYTNENLGFKVLIPVMENFSALSNKGEVAHSYLKNASIHMVEKEVTQVVREWE